MAAELPRPGVEIIQEFTAASPTIVRPTLVPFVCGAAKEIVEVTTADGLLNADAKQGVYEQLPRVISQSSFPSPRGNIAEVNVEEETIKVFFQFGGSLKQLERDPGESFLVAFNNATRPVIRSSPFTTATGLALNGKILILAMDVTARLNATQDVTVTFAGTGNLTPAQIIAQINDAVGEDVASEVVLGSKSRIQIASLMWGAAASVTVRAGGSANTVFGFTDPAVETRVEGSGFRAQDLNNNTTLSPWIEWSKGSYQLDGVAQGSLPSYSDEPGSPTTVVAPGFISEDGTFAATFSASGTTFIGTGSLDLEVGDEFYVDGVLPNSAAAIMKVESTRFKLGIINTKLSVFDDEGRVVSAVYDQSSVNTLYASAPFAPRNAWFMAHNLTGNEAATAAILTGTTEGKAAETATLEAPNVATYGAILLGTDQSFPFTAVEAETFVVSYSTADPESWTAKTLTWTAGTKGPHADIAALVAALNTGSIWNGGTLPTQFVISASGNKVKIVSAASGPLAKLKITTSTGIGTDPDTELGFTLNQSGVGGLPLAGLTLEVDVTIDGVEQDTYVYTFTGGPFADVAAVVTAIGTNIPGVFAHTNLGGTKLALSTVKTGATQALTLKGTSTALAALGWVAATTYSDEGIDVEFVDIAASLLGTTQEFLPDGFTAVEGETFAVSYSTADPESWTTKTLIWTAGTIGPHANITALVAALNTGSIWVGGLPTAFAITASGNKIKITSTATGSLAKLKIAASTGIGTDPDTELGFTLNQTDTGEENLNGQTLKFQLNERPKTYSVLFTSDSLVEAVAAVNEAVGWPVASIAGDSDNQLAITSTLLGYASKVVIVSDTTSEKAIAALGFGGGNDEADGDGRPNPDFSVDVSGNVVLGGEILRSVVTGAPFDPGTSDIYLQYRGLRKDVSPLATRPGLLRISNVTDLQAVLSPIRSDNPLALGMFFQIINAPGIESTGLGVDEISAAEPYGTPLAFTRVSSFLEAEEVYAISLLTHSETVASIFKTHIELMSGPEQKGERILFFNPLVPDRAVNDVVASGLSGNTTATDNQFLMDVNPTGELVSRGLDPALLTYEDMVTLELTVTVSGVSEVRRYSVSSVSATLATLNTTFASDENTDDFHTVTPLTETLVNADWSLYVRGEALLISGSTLPDKNKIAETVAAKAAAYKQRRMYYVFPDKAKATLGGTEELIEGFYVCPAIGGMIAHFPPQQGFTNLPVTGFTGISGSNDTFSAKQLNVMAAGGTYIMVQDAQGAPIISRHQLSTNLTSIETRELSITKVVDFVAKFLRTGLRNFIGTFNITQPFLDTLSTVIQGMLGFLVESGVILGGDLNNLIQSKDAPDTVLVDVTLDVPYPCNYIRLTLVI